ncbi:MAG: hypothetical protein KUG81_10350 [Gammaproteobacteria bacterium]|nr:hypothetical protein [Gammaproteobacteria bacterium]
MSGVSIISDGRTGNKAGVSDENRLLTASVSQPHAVASSLNGDTFFIETGLINLTSDTLSHLLYFKNTDGQSWGVESWSATFGATDGTGDVVNIFTFAPTGGTLLDSGTDGVVANLNFGSAKQLGVVVKIGAEGSTLTGGAQTPDTLIPEGVSFREFPASPIIIPAGASIAAGFKPPPGNTSMNVSTQLVVYRV